MKKICIVFLGIMVLLFLGMDLVNISYAYDGKEVTALVSGGSVDADVKDDIQLVQLYCNVPAYSNSWRSNIRYYQNSWIWYFNYYVSCFWY